MDNVLERCPVVIETPVAWGQMDAFRHLNNTAYFRFFESARIAYFEKLDLLKFMETTGVGPILAATNCRFKIPLTYPDTVSIGSRVPEIENDRFTMEYYVVSHKHQRVAAEGTGLIVCFNYMQKKKTPVPVEISNESKHSKLQSHNRGIVDVLRFVSMDEGFEAVIEHSSFARG